jgi:hypothetical protein
MFRNLAAQGDEGQYADALLTEMKRTQPRQPGDAAAIQNLISAEGINQGYDATEEQALRQAMRSGGGTGDIMAKIGRARGEDLRKAFLTNQQGAEDQAYNEYSTKVGNLANLYNTFRTRASAMPAVEYKPRNVEGQTADLMAQAGRTGQQGSANLLNAYEQPTPQLKYTAQPQYGMANTLANLGSSIGNINFSNMNLGGNYSSYPSYGTDDTNKYQAGRGLY